MKKRVFAPHLNRAVVLGGRRRPRVVHPHLKLRDYLRASLPSPPSSVDLSAAATPVLRDIFLNDQLGDCVIAGGYHIVGTETGNAGDLYHATTQQVTADYSAIGGYVPGDESTDNGCELQTALAYWQAHGFSNGTKLIGYLAVDPANWSEVMAACWLFENLYFGMELPDAWVNPFPSADDFVWSNGAPDENNGHCVMSPATYDSKKGVRIDTWALLGWLTPDAIAHLCSSAGGGELWVMLTPDQMAKGAQKAPNGVAWSDIVADWDSIGGHVPAPAPAPPPPAPYPSAPPSLAQAQSAVVAALAAQHSLLTRGQAENVAKAALTPLWPVS